MDFTIQTTPGEPIADFSWLAGDSAAFENAQTGTLDVSALVSGIHYDATTKVVPAGLAVAQIGNTFVPWVGADEVQTVTITGGPAGGTFTLSFDGETTAAIAYNAAASSVQAALEALSNLAAGDVTVSGSAGGPYTVTFTGARGGVNVSQLTSTSSLTGGSSPAIAHATTTAGGAGTAGAEVLARFTAAPLELKRADGTLSTTVVFAGIVDATIIPAKLPVTAQRTIDRNTPTSGKFGFIQ